MRPSHKSATSFVLWLPSFAFLVIAYSTVFSQSTAAPSPTPTATTAKSFFANILKDQKGLWSSPFHLQQRDAKWIAPIGLSMAALLATDTRTSSELVENGDNRSRLRMSKDISYTGSLYSLGGVAATFYLTGRMRHDERAKETGLLAAEALLDSTIISQALKGVSGRQRPRFDNGTGEFLDGGSSFPSGHAINSWAVATVIAQEYGPAHPAVPYVVYGLATAIGISRYTGRKHFLSDVLAGGALGYGIGRYVYHQHHDPTLDGETEKQTSRLFGSKFFPSIASDFRPRARSYGARVAWSF
ncbi:MAG TPA: phosphatase PAP2 family protein [Pyrinomonadaceae bacterium]|nr:phosphatase PAP2 family protein [Pyrinomonadaceae bacterium]